MLIGISYICMLVMKDIIKKYQFKENHKLEFEILDLEEILKEKSSMMTVPHRAQFYHVLWIEKGEGVHYVDFNPIAIENNSLIFVPHNSVNKYDLNGFYKGKAILFTEAFFCKNNEDHQFLHSSMLFSDIYPTANFKVSKQDRTLQILLNGQQVEYQHSYDYAQYQILHNMLHIFLLQSEREMRKQGLLEIKPSINLDYLIAFKDLLEKQFRKEKSVNKYASELNVTEKQLYKATTTLLEKTPKQIIDERIILEAKRLLVYSNMTVKEIAYELGYNEPTNFNKYFRKHTDNTPADFRKLA